MGSKNTIPDITLTIQSGGSIAFEKTGILPEFLIFHSAQLRRTWCFKLKENKQNGVLKVNGQITWYYFFDGFSCKMQTVADQVITSEWDIEEILMEMRD